MNEQRPDHYVAADCPNCGRRRLEMWTDDSERAVGLRCEKCFAQWPISAGNATGFLIDGPYFSTENQP